MAKAKSTPAVPAVAKPITNESQLKFPQDVHGLTQKMKREVARAIGRLSGDKEKLAVFMGTLEVLAKYAVDKFDWQVAERTRFATEEQSRIDAARTSERAVQMSLAAKVRKEASALIAQADEIEAENAETDQEVISAREAYKDKFNKEAHPNAKAETLLARIAKAGDE